MVSLLRFIFANVQYYIPTPHLDRILVKAVSAAVYTCPDLFIALRIAGADIRSILIGWVEWQRTHVAQESIRQDYYLCRFGLDFCRYLAAEVVDSLGQTAPFFADIVRYFEVRYALQRGYITAPTTFRRFEYDVQRIAKLLRQDSQALNVERAPSDLLFVTLAAANEYGFAYLEVKVPRTESPLVCTDDELEIRDLVKQLLTRPDIVVRNKTQKRVFATKHHLTQNDLQTLRLRHAA